MNDILIYIIPIIVLLFAFLGFKQKRVTKTIIESKIIDSKIKEDLLEIREIVSAERKFVLDTKNKLREIDNESYNNDNDVDLDNVNDTVNKLLARSKKGR